MPSFIFTARFPWGLTLAVGILVTSAAPADWPYWRGPRYDGTADATGLPEDWDPEGGEGSNLLWKRDDVGGICTPVSMNGRLYTIQRSDADTEVEGERVLCLDAATGETLWEHSYNVWLSDVPAERVGWSSPVADPETGYVYVLGSCDIFMCLDGETGDVVWNKPLHEQFGMLSTYGGRTNFPIIHEDLVIISGIIINWGDRAKPNHRLLGLDKKTGEVVWFSGTRDLPYDTSYSAPSLVTIDGQRQLILGCGDGQVWGFQPRTGKPLWSYPFSRRGLYATPLVVGNRVFAGHSEENVSGSAMGAMVGLEISGTGDDTTVKELWKIEELVCGYGEPVMVDDRLYVLDDRNKMWVIQADTGEIILEKKSVVGSRQRSALFYADGKLYVLSEGGGWAILEPTEDGFEVLNKQRRIRGQGFAASPIASGGRVYFQGTNTLYCLDTGSGSQTMPTAEEVLGQETPVSQNPAATQLLLVPNESLIKPGESIQLSVRAYNRIGQPVETPADVELTVQGPGTIDGMTFVADAQAQHTAAVIHAKAGDATGVARVRIVPSLPWRFTFDDLSDPPLSWVGARYRHVIRDVDGSPALTKISTIPKGARSRAWMGPSDMAEYTISADVMGSRNLDQLPDIGLTAQGYVLDLMGQSQQLQIRTWVSSEERARSTVPFEWKEGVWYRMKFSAEIESEGPAATAILRGKIWPRDEPEPKEWTVTARDESPVLSASPGLYGNAKVAELYLDNIEVTANED
ncbi:PQQ-binding-like beta-propeller repeat protein [Crateriforma spongiae]|uniref:outer membrane protein assembly factor BamB family protein n=1 Tax=Crateriforma spongiae TaxID=2724528 RepID=UPI00144773FE|nr:PQQ-binding-like beta-propeller repeat protein [Crateriforma spongiae]